MTRKPTPARTPTTPTRCAPGWRPATASPQAEDDRVAIACALADTSTSPTLRAAANAALDDNTPGALRHFLEEGRYQVA
ncbi:hypothetical protein ABT275_41345 [Streptomyces sp. NPDC001185]|uniref:hypothetical protein n=1 Tax=Streptomyces sp. NPDC001185 TaxID=3154380 RepID=UPI0033335C50